MSKSGALRAHLMLPTAVAPADGLEVRVRSVRATRDEVGRPQLEIRYAVPGLPDGVAQIPPDEPPVVAEELTAWATEHVRRYRPPRVASDADLSVDLPLREELWSKLIARLGAYEEDGGLVFREDDEPLKLVLTPEQWQRHVFACERGARLDHGVDADGPGDGPELAIEDISETAGSRSPGEDFIVLTERGFRSSTRPELPPVRSRDTW